MAASIVRKPMRYAHAEGHTDVCFSDDGKYIITCGVDGDVRTWCGLEDDDPSSHCVGEKALAVHHKGKNLFVGTDNNNVQAYTFPEMEKDGIISSFTAPVTHITTTKDGNKVISGSCDMMIQVRDNSTNFNTLSGHSAPVLSVSVDPEAKYVASSSCDGTIRVWSLASLKVVKLWSCLPVCNSFYLAKCLGRTSWHPNSGKYIAIPDERQITLYEKDTWEKFTSFSADVKKEFSIAAFSPCGKYLAGSTTLGEICVWHVWKQTCLGYTQHDRCFCISSLAWNPTNNGEVAYCDTSGQLGTLEGCTLVTTDRENEQYTDLEKISELQGDYDDDGENVISLEKIKASVSKPVSDGLLDLDLDDVSVKDDDEESKASGPVARLVDIQPPFQPTSTPVHLQHRYMVWNSVGIVRCFNTEEENSIDVEFHDSALHHSIHMNNFLKHGIADLSEKALVLACETLSDTPSKIVCVLLNSWDGSREWSVDLPNEEEVLAVATASNWLATATDVRNLRFFTITGTQREIIALPGPIVCLASYEDVLLVTYHNGSGLNFTLLSVTSAQVETLVPHQPVPLSPLSTLQWAGFSDEGTPCCMDSAGMLRILSTKGYWTPVCDMQAQCKGKSDHYFILGVSEKYENIRCILCKGARYPATTPRPTVIEVSMKLPLCEPASEKSVLEETFWRSQIIVDTLNSVSKVDYTYLKSKDDVEKVIKETFLKLFVLACQSGLESRALDLCGLMPSNIVQFAIKYASRVGKTSLAEKIADIATHKESKQWQDASHKNSTCSRFTWNSNSRVVKHKTMVKEGGSLADDIDPFASTPEEPSGKENILLTIKQKMSIMNDTPPSGNQRKENPFKKNKENGVGQSSIANQSSSQSNKESDSSKKSEKSNTPTVVKVKQTVLWDKTPNPTPPSSKPMSFITWFSKEKPLLTEEFPEMSMSELTRLAMKRYKEYTTKEKDIRASPAEPIARAGCEENAAEVETEKETLEAKKRKLEDEDTVETPQTPQFSAKLAKYTFKK